ncbi:type II toxin-antitoxin system HicB family antitoxin [Candidatus Daviesbacteria bacterium]|nr:type II toxin-antitoxin system HicB family antitoxin [Candidatus Daviesbacteria bacterium]
MFKQTEKVSEYELPIKIWPQKNGGFVVTSPLWNDCYAQGDTVDEAVLEITALAQSLIELYKEEGLKIPLKLAGEKKFDNPNLSVPILVAV